MQFIFYGTIDELKETILLKAKEYNKDSPQRAVFLVTKGCTYARTQLENYHSNGRP